MSQLPPPSRLAAPIRLVTVLAGQVASLGGVPSGIAKTPAEGPLFLGRTGLAGDRQADLRAHGGSEKALHQYPLEHYQRWLDSGFPAVAALAPGGFGENLSTLGVTEDSVCIGDVFRLGGSVVQVSQPRLPCWKLDLRFGQPGFAYRVQETGWTGWYYRVVEEGEIAAGDRFELVSREAPDWPLSRLLQVWFGTPLDRALLEAIIGLPSLDERWRARAQQRLDSGRVEDWSTRLSAPAPVPPTPSQSRP